MKGVWTEDLELMSQLSDAILYSMTAFPKKIVHTDELVRDHGLPFSQIQLLALLSTKDVTVTEAARHLNVAKTNLALLVKHLYEKGYIERQPDVKDKRKVCLHLSEQGRKKYNTIKDSVIEQISKMENDFSRSEIKILYKSISQINHVLYRL